MCSYGRRVKMQEAVKMRLLTIALLVVGALLITMLVVFPKLQPKAPSQPSAPTAKCYDTGIVVHCTDPNGGPDIEFRSTGGGS
jgi:hypothetical protein